MFTKSIPLKKIKKGIYEFTASAPEPDCVGDVVATHSYLPLPTKPLPVLDGHDHARVVGVTEKLFVEDAKLIARINIENCPACIDKVENQGYEMSIGFTAKRGDQKQIEGGGTLFLKIRINEVSLVPRGCAVGATRRKNAPAPPTEKQKAVAELRKQLGVLATRKLIAVETIRALQSELVEQLHAATGSLDEPDVWLRKVLRNPKTAPVIRKAVAEMLPTYRLVVERILSGKR